LAFAISQEDEFHREATVPVVESLMSINNKLGQKEAATGLLEWGRKNLQVICYYIFIASYKLSALHFLCSTSY
jgi:hypothetical protein